MEHWVKAIQAGLKSGEALTRVVKVVIDTKGPNAPDPNCVASKLSGIPKPTEEDIRRAVRECMTQTST